MKTFIFGTLLGYALSKPLRRWLLVVFCVFAVVWVLLSVFNIFKWAYTK